MHTIGLWRTDDEGETALADSDALVAENRHLRELLIQAHGRVDAEQQRNARLGRMVAGELLARHEPPGARPGLPDPRWRARPPLGSSRPWQGADCVMLLDRGGHLIAAGENVPALLGVPALAGLRGQSWVSFWSCPEARAAARAALEEARAGRPERFRARPEAGAPVWWEVAVTPLAEADGRIERILTVARDVTEQTRDAERQTLLVQEMAHRVKNTLALVQAVAAQTLRNAASLEAAGDALGARLLALAQAHDVLVGGAAAGASMAALVAAAVALHGGGREDGHEAGRFTVSGPDFGLGPRPALTWALMLHELGTNAAKYGALSVPGGHVVLAWEIAESAAGPVLRFRWEEIGGPPVQPPTRTGFGSRLIGRSLAQGLGGRLQHLYPPEGVLLTLEAPLQALVAA